MDTKPQPTLNVLPDGYRVWRMHGERHREGGPALERADGSRAWRLHGQLHREDGPAVEYADGSREWWLHGVRMAEAEH